MNLNNTIIHNYLIGNHNLNLIKQAEDIINNSNINNENFHSYITFKIGDKEIILQPNEKVEINYITLQFFEKEREK